MSKVTICDVCGEVATRYFSVNIKAPGITSEEREKDICPNCYSILKKYSGYMRNDEKEEKQ